LTTAEWVQLSTGQRHRPGEKVELTEEQAAGLIKAGCLVPVEGKATEPAPVESAEATKPKSRKRR